MQAEDDSPAREGGSTPGEAAVRAHYGRPGLFEEIMAALAAVGKDIRRLTISDLAPVDHFHGRGVEATAEMADLLPVGAGDRLLDIGSGLGGPARYMADRFGCHVSGIDLTEEFCETARRLAACVGMSGRVTFRQGNATALPFASASFDAAYTQNVSMNIADKRRFHAEALRVLRAGGHFALSEVTLGKGGLPFYPTPWSEDGTTSHLRTEEETLAGLQGAGFHVLSVLDRSEATIVFLRRMRERIARDGPPRIGTHILMGPGAREKARNSARNVEEGRIKPIEVLCRKPD